MRKLLSLITVLCCLMAGTTWASVEQSRETDSHSIYYNVLPTSALPEAMARAYGITRSDTRVLLNIAVHRKDPDGAVPVEAEIEAQAVNLPGQLKRFRMRRLSEDDAIYYIGEIGISRGENLNFELRITPEGEDEAEVIRFRRTF